MSPTIDSSRSRSRFGPFGWGAALGGVLALAAAGISWPYPTFDSWNVGVDVTGKDADRLGVARVSVTHDRGGMTQACVGGCDDVQLREASSDNAYEMKAVDKAGACVVCTAEGYVTNGIRTRFTVGG